jgi:uncharacterized protein involved in response to NO
MSDWLVLVLHIGFFFAASGFLFASAHALAPNIVMPAAAAHVWAIGAIGTMTLAMMSRATLGHTGRELSASRLTQFIYAAIIVATLTRVAMEFIPVAFMPLMYVAALAWIAAFAGFIVAYGPMLVRPRNDDRL